MEDIFIQKKRGRKPKNKDNYDLVSKSNFDILSKSNSLNLSKDIINDPNSFTPDYNFSKDSNNLQSTTNLSGKSEELEYNMSSNQLELDLQYKSILPGLQTSTNIDDDIIKKKRGRKPTGKIYEINKSLISNMSSGISNCIIAHLPLSEKDIVKIIGKEQIKLTEDQYSDNLSDIIHSDSINDTTFSHSKNKTTIKRQNSDDTSSTFKNQMPSHSSFVIEADDDIKHKYNEKCVEIDNLKKRYDDLLEKFKKFAYLEDKITDNGVIEKKYYVANSNIYDLCGNCWRESSDSHCWWCSHSFETVPVGLPNKYCPKQKKFYLYGCFCSFNCAHSYNLDIKDYKVWERYALLNYIKKIIYTNVNNTDNLIKPIISAPPKEVLKVYGGELSIEEYRNSSISIPKEYYHLLPPMIPIFSVVEEIPKFFYQDRGSKKKNDFGELKIKRNKPLLTQNNNLLNLIK